VSDPPTVSRGLGGRRQLILLRAKTLHGGYLGSFVRVCPRVQSVEHGQLRVIDDVNGVVESIGRILLGPIRVRCRGHHVVGTSQRAPNAPRSPRGWLKFKPA